MSTKEAEASDSRALKYKAFISYSHANKEWGEWLHKSLENYRVPSAYVGTKNDFGQKIERKLGKIFRDRDELTSGYNLSESIRAALEVSENLIVICSPQSARSRYVNQEIVEFKQLGRSDHLHAFIVSGEPHAGETPAPGSEECLPQALRYTVDESGQITDCPAPEVLAPDAREGRDGKSRAKLKLIAGLLGVEYDLLFQREKRRARHKYTAIGVVVAFCIFLAWTAIQNFLASRRDQRITRHEAYATALNQVEEHYRANEHPRAVELLIAQKPQPGAEDVREFSWHYLWRLYDNHRHRIFVPGETTSITLSADSRKLAISNDTRTVTLWDLVTGKQLGRIEDLDDNVRFADFTPDGKSLLTAGKRSKSRIWDANSGQMQKTHPDQVSYVARSPDAGTLVISGNSFGDLEFQDQRSGQRHQLETLIGHGAVNGLSFSPDSRDFALGYEHGVLLLDVPTGAKKGYIDFRNKANIKDVNFATDSSLLGIAVTGKESHDLVLWDVAASKERLTLRGPDVGRGELVFFRFSADGSTVALLVGSPTIISPQQHSELVVWDTKSGRRLFTLPQEQTGFVTAAEFAPHGNILATGSRDHAVRFWDASTGALRNVLGIHHDTLTRDAEQQNIHHDPRVLVSHHETQGGGIPRLLFSADGKTVVTASRVYGSVTVWDAQTEAENLAIPQRPDEYYSIAFSPDKKTVAAGDTQGTVALWDIPRGARISEWGGAHQGSVYALAFSPRGDQFVSAGSDRVIRLWRTDTMQQESSFSAPPRKSPGLSAGRLLLNDKILVNLVRDFSPSVATREIVDATVWDLATNRSPLQVSGPLIVLADDGSRLASAGCKTIVWNLATRLSQVLFEDQNCSESDWQKAAISSDGQYLAVGGPEAGRDPQTGKKMSGIRLLRVAPKSDTFLPLSLGFSHDDALSSLEFSPDGKLLASMSAVSGRPALTLWDLATGKQKEVFTPVASHEICQGFRGASCARIGGFSPDGQTLALISGVRMPQAGESEVTLWHLNTGRKERFISRHRVDGVVFSPNSNTFATLISSNYGEPAVLRARETGQEIANIGNYAASINSLRQTADGGILAATSEYPASDPIVAKVWDVRKGLLRTSQRDWGGSAKGPASIAAQGQHLAANLIAGVLVWNLDGNAALRTLNGQELAGSTPFSADGELIATVRKGQVIVSHASTGQELRAFDGKPPVAFSLPEHKIFATTSDCETVKLWNLDTGAVMGSLSGTNCVIASTFSPDGRTLVTVNSAALLDRLGAEPEARLWDVRTHREMPLQKYEGGREGLVAFTPDGKTLATAGKDGKLDLWDPVTGRRLLSLPGREQGVKGIEFSRDGSSVVVAYDTSVGIYRGANTK